MTTQVAPQLDWQAFTARYFPERHRHDFEVLKAYEAYRNGSPVTGRLPSEGGTPSEAALAVWEGEGGAVRGQRRRASARVLR